MSMNRMYIGDYTVVISWLTKLVEWMPPVLADDPARKANTLAMLAESELAVNRANECLNLVNEALRTCYFFSLLLIKLKAMFALSASDARDRQICSIHSS